MGKFYSLLTSVGIYEQNLSLPSYEMYLKLMENALIEGLRLSKDTIRTLGNSGIVKMRSGKIATKKEDKTLHGIGLKSVESAVNNHNGTMKVDFNEKEFQVNVMLYI